MMLHQKYNRLQNLHQNGVASNVLKFNQRMLVNITLLNHLYIPYSHGEWYSLLKKSSGLVFYGTEHFLSYFSPDSLAPLSIAG